MSMKLVILGLLLEGDKHPYEVQHIMKNDKWIVTLNMLKDHFITPSSN